MPSYRIDASPSSYKGNPQPPSRSTGPVNTVAQSPLYGRGGAVDQHGHAAAAAAAAAALDRSGRFVTYQPGPPPQQQPSHSQQQQQQMNAVNSTAMSAFRNAEERGGPRPHRMSLLHPPQPPPTEYNIPPASAPMTPRPDRPSPQGPPYGGESSGMGKIVAPNMSESPPCKKLRLGDSKPDVHLPLRIDTDRARSGPAYNPQVEAISPTLPSEPLRDESPLRSTKEDLMQQLARLDREIAKTESQIAKLKKKKVELEEAATQPERDLEEPAAAPETMNRSLPHIIYAENRKKAQEAHQILSKLGPKVDLPLYNQPSDTAVYHENKVKYGSLKTKLQDYFKNKIREKEKRENYLTTTYAKLSADWARRLEKIENNAKKKAKDAKTREIFEKVFPELRKQREDKERFSRVGSRIKSDADLEEIMDGLHEQELEDKKMRSYAVIPPIILDEKSRKRRFNNRNGLIEDPMQEYKDKQLLNLWTEQEKDIFKEKYLQHPKNFSMIKSYLERKSVADCVQYYYLSKKAQNYRQLLRKNRARTRSTRNQQNNATNNSATAGSVGVSGMTTIKQETNGVTTRGQKEQVKNEQQSAAAAAVSGPITSTSASTGVINSSSTTSTVTTSAISTASISSFSTTQSLTTAVSNSNSAPSTTTTNSGPTSTSGGNGNSISISITNTNNNNNNNNNNNSGSNNGSVESNNVSSTVASAAPSGNSGSNAGNSTNSSNGNNSHNNLTGNNQSNSSASGGSGAVPSAPAAAENSAHSIPTSGPSSEFIVKTKGKSRKDESKDALHNEMDSTDDENEPYTGEKGVPHTCVVCKSAVESYMHSRVLPRSQVAQYGLSESDVQTGDRVCNTCRCKSVRHRYKPSKQCPIPTCPAKKARVKRLRPFPAIWKDLSDDRREAIMAKYQIPPTATKCCTACCNRINRRLSPNASLDTPDDPGSDTTRWTDDEIDTMKKALAEYGTDWRKLSERINNKSELQCRNFYFNFRKKYGLDALVQEFKKSKGGGDGPPTLTDEEESGSTTSSCDETVAHTPHDQSPRHHHHGGAQSKNKVAGVGVGVGADDYDSSATVSAEESVASEVPEKTNPVQELRQSAPPNPGSPLSLTVRASSHPERPERHIHQQQQPPPQPPPQSRVQNVPHHHSQENGGQGAISLVSSHHHQMSGPPPPQSHPQHQSIHPPPPHPLHSSGPGGPLSLGQRSSPSTMPIHHSAVSQHQQSHVFHSTPVISHGSSQLNHHPGQQPQAHQVMHGGPPSHHHLSSPHHQGHLPRGIRYPSPDGPDGQEPISVRVDDLMSATIERHLRRNPVNPPSSQMHPGPSVSPTLQSILKSQPPPTTHHLLPQIQQGNNISNLAREPPSNMQSQGPPGLQQGPSRPPSGPPGSSHVTAQAPSSSPHFPPHHMNYGGGPKVDVPRIPQMQHHLVPREVSIVQLPQRDDCGTLDLSMKKRPASPTNMSHAGGRPPSNGPPPAHSGPLDFAARGPPPPDMYGYPQKFSNPNVGQRHQSVQPPPPIVSRNMSLNPPPAKQAKVPPPPALITKPPSVSPMKDGSITHGTPIHPHANPQQMQSKFDPGLVRPPSKEGSITQGTPKGPMSSYVMYERPPSEYYKRMSPAGSTYPYHASPTYFPGQRPPSSGGQAGGGGGQRSPPVHPSPQTSPFSADQHNSSRQIIINDYYTSQQMQQPVPTQHPPQASPSSLGQPRNVEPPPQKRNVNQPGGPGPMYMLPPRQEIPYRQSPPPSSIPPPTQHRQGVIQRANTNRPVIKEEHPGRYAAHDAFSSLVDVASSAPSLPVPKEENRRVCLPRVEGLGKSMADMERNRVGGPPPMNQPTHPSHVQQQQQQHQPSPHMYRTGPVPTNQPPGEPLRLRPKPEVYGRDSQDSTLTAASLIDAIITHQINQPSPNDRQSPAPPRTGDRLFASFQRTPAISQGPPQQQSPHNLSIPNQHHVHGHGPPSQHEEKVVVNDVRSMNHKMQQGVGGGGTTWGEQINLIISNDYASGKGGVMSSNAGLSGGGPIIPGGGGPPPHMHGHGHPPTTSPHHIPVQNSHSSIKKGGPMNTNAVDEDAMHYKSWKLRKALQLEQQKEQQQQALHLQQQQQQHQQHQQQHQHPDERRIIRVHSEEPGMVSSRPPSMPSRMSPESHFPSRVERGEPMKPGPGSGPSIGPGGVPAFAGRSEGISLDYFNNLIMEKMRNENNDVIKTEDGHHGKHDTSSVGPPISVPNMNLPGGSASHPHSNPVTSIVHGHPNTYGGLASRIAAAAAQSRDDHGPHSDHRGGDAQMDKMDDEPSKGGDSDSPASMVIDESADIKENVGKSHSQNDSTSTITSQPNYEPLTDEEN